jgi:hypothetical protein
LRRMPRADKGDRTANLGSFEIFKRLGLASLHQAATQTVGTILV